MRRARRLAAGALVALATVLPASSDAAVPRPSLAGAKSAILVDSRDGHVLLQKRPSEERAIASATKLMTALLALERARPDQVFTAAAYSPLPVESKINLRRGERMRVDDLLEALLLESANDAAVTLAEGISGSRDAFVREMNTRAAQLGLADTMFANPIGLDDPSNYSSARDLARLAARLERNPTFAAIVDRPSAVLESGARRRVVRNRNRLVGRYPFVDGIKTGHTLSAGYVLVGAAKRPGASVISVVLGEPSEAARDASTLALLRYGLDQFRRRRVLARGADVTSVEVEGRSEEAPLEAGREVALTLRRGERVTRRVRAPGSLEGPLPAGRRVGRVALVRGGEVVATVPLVTAAEVPGPSFLSRSGVVLTLAILAIMVSTVALVAGRRRRARAR